MLKQKFKDIFQQSNSHDGNGLQILKSLDGESGLAQLLNTDLKRGIQSQQQVDQLRQEYGANIPPEKKQQTLCQLIMECFKDTMLIILIISAIASMIINILEEGVETGWMEGATILFAVFLVITITATNNYAKQNQFKKLQGKLDEQKCEVIRNGETKLVDAHELVVGDLFIIHIGDILSVDGILAHGSEIKIDESSLTGETLPVRKFPLHEIDHHHHQHGDPFLISGSKVVDGSGLMLILQVGSNTNQASVSFLLQQETPPTPLQLKLEDLAGDIGKFGTIAAIITFIILVFHYDVDCMRGFEKFLSISTLHNFADSFMIAITIIVVAVPEGLPLAVTITLAFSVNKMKDQQNLVKVLDSCEIMGRANNICTDKTGTLTQNQMKVAELWLENKLASNYNIYNQDNFNQKTVKLLAESICYNSSANPKKKKLTGVFEHIGNSSECALLQMVDIFGYYYEQYRPSDKIIRIIPFNSKRKQMITIVRDETTLIVYVKGASEIILENSSKFISTNGQICDLDNNERNRIRSMVIDNLSTLSYRTIGIAYKEIDQNLDDDQIQEITEKELSENLILISIAGIKDLIRETVRSAIMQCQRSGILVRMITGDNILTAQSIAKECGILDINYQNSENSYQIMDGSTFRQLVEGYETVKDKKGKERQKIKNLDKFKQIAKELRVLARASPEDKFTLVLGLIELDNVVAVTGDGTNDAPALKKADVGFAMGIAGSQVAKEAADIILIDDNFSSIIIACMWGRNIYNCIRKFIQFQLTVNVVALFMSVLGAIITKQAPLNATEMLWANLIMDTFASLALATEPPSIEVLDRQPFKRNESILTSIMWRTIIGQSIYQIIALNIILFALPQIMDLSLPVDFKHSDDYPGDIITLTMFFQAFILMQVFHSITCRKLDEKSLNPLSNMFNNPMFWFIQSIIVVIQYLVISFGGRLTETVPLTFGQHMICLGFGVLGMIIGILVRFIPPSLFDSISVFKKHHLEESNEEDDHDNSQNSSQTQSDIELATK